jgi:heat shock protein HtpX
VTHLILLALIALVPAAFAWWNGRALVAFADDPVLPERLLANRGRNAFVYVFSLALMVPFGWTHLAWAAPLLIVARMAAAYRIRKTLYRDTWSFRTYLSFFLRLSVAVYGFWVALALFPGVAVMAGSRDWIAGIILAAILALWSRAYGRVFCAILHAKPVDDGVSLSRFAQILERCGLRHVSLKQVDMRGGVFANAVALPSLTAPAVLVSSTLVERLDADETAGILAHEVAHIEQFNPRVLRGMARVTHSLIAAGAVLAPAIRLAFPAGRGTLLMLWPAAVVVALVLRARHRQQRETDSDLRAVSLTGNPDALVRALTKLHAFARIPRRWDTEVERHQTHPSLARRIQAIRHAAGTAGAPLAETATFVDVDAKRTLTFHPDRLELHEGAAGSHAIGYGLLTTLRIDAGASAAPRLVAIDRSKRRWDVALRQCDLGRAQATLDVIDGHLAAAAPPAIPPVLTRVTAAIALLLSLMAGQIAVVLVAWLAMLQPALLGAAGASAIAAALLAWRDQPAWMQPEPWTALALLLSGVALIVMRARDREEATTRLGAVLTGVLAVAAVGACALTLVSGTDALALHQGAREWPSAVLTAALAGAAAFSRSNRVRLAAVPLACAGLAITFVGSTMFLVHFADDPFVARAQPIALDTLTANPIVEFTVPFEANGLWVSPDGRYVALSSEDEEERTTIHAGPAGGPLTDFAADEAVFVDRGRLLLLERHRTTAALRLVDLESGNREIWSRRVRIWAGALSISRLSNTWRLLGMNESGNLSSVVGRIGEDTASEEQWKSPGTGMSHVVPLAVSNGELLAVETRYASSLPTTGLQLWAAAMTQSAPHSESQLWMIGRHGRTPFSTSRLSFDCRMTSLDEPVTCAAFDGTRTGFFEIDPDTRRTTAAASLSGRFSLHGDADRGWLAGWLDGCLVVINPSARQGIRMTGADRRAVAHTAAMSDTLMGAVFPDADASTVRLYPR